MAQNAKLGAIVAKAVRLACLGEASESRSEDPPIYRSSVDDFAIEVALPSASGRPGSVSVRAGRWEVLRASLKPRQGASGGGYEVEMASHAPEGWRERFLALSPDNVGAV